MQVARVNSIATHYRTDGPETGRPVVFANSLGTDFRIWDRVLPHLPQDLRVIRYDKRGHGLSQSTGGDYHMGEDLVADLAGLLDHLDVRGAVVVGLSIGGMIAQGLAAERPDLVRAMVLCDTGARIGTEAMWAERMETIRKGGLSALAEPILERWFSRAFRADRQDELAIWRNMLTRTPVEGYLGCCAAIRDTDLLESTSRLRLPTLAMVGDEDGATPPDLVRETAGLVPGASFHVVRGAGHLPCIEQPEAVATLLSDFLATL